MGVIQNNWLTTDWLRYSWLVPTGYQALNAQWKIVTFGNKALNTQATIVAYNINLLRILWEIKSDGTAAGNFTASSEASTDKAVVNLKSDIIEKYWQSTGCSAEWIVWDSGSGKVISLDTFALIEHNLTSSAVVTLKGYGNSASSAPVSWAGVPVYATFTMPDDPDETNLIWIAPVLPSSSFRWWRLDIADSTNPDGVIRAGRLAAGSALVFNAENCLDSIDYLQQNFKDEQKLNGFSSIANNRALKKYMRLSFKDLDTTALANYRALKRYGRYCRDTLKALVIVDPSTETTKYKYTLFSKLKAMPKESHRFVDANTDYAVLDLEFDEGR